MAKRIRCNEVMRKPRTNGCECNLFLIFLVGAAEAWKKTAYIHNTPEIQEVGPTDITAVTLDGRAGEVWLLVLDFLNVPCVQVTTGGWQYDGTVARRRFAAGGSRDTPVSVTHRFI